MPTPMVQTRQKSDNDEPRLGEEDRRAYHRCVDILRHLVRYRPDIAFAVHEVSKSLASPRDADLRRLRRLGRYLCGTRKLGVMIRKANDSEHVEAYTDADWSGDPITRKGTSGGVRKIITARIHERSELPNTLERRKRVPRCSDDDSRSFWNSWGHRSSFDFASTPQQHAESSKDKDAVLSSMLKRDFCDSKRNTRKESWS